VVFVGSPKKYAFFYTSRIATKATAPEPEVRRYSISVTFTTLHLHGIPTPDFSSLSASTFHCTTAYTAALQLPVHFHTPWCTRPSTAPPAVASQNRLMASPDVTVSFFSPLLHHMRTPQVIICTVCCLLFVLFVLFAVLPCAFPYTMVHDLSYQMTLNCPPV
jgi:hypothetical protein